MTPTQYNKLVAQLFEVSKKLREQTGRPITPDGHMVGGLGEAFVDAVKDLTPAVASARGIDGTEPDGRTTVQIKTTTRDRITLSGLEPGAHVLAAVQLNRESGEPTVVYYGPAKAAWDLGGDRRREGQWTLSLRYLAALASNTEPNIFEVER